jgi:mRNA interferase RelE/StbE
MNVSFKNSFLKEIEKLKDQSLKDEILESIVAVESAKDISEIKKIKKLKGFDLYYRIRIGNYRIGLKIENGTVHFAAFEHRKDIYKKFP